MIWSRSEFWVNSAADKPSSVMSIMMGSETTFLARLRAAWSWSVMGGTGSSKQKKMSDKNKKKGDIERRTNFHKDRERSVGAWLKSMFVVMRLFSKSRDSFLISTGRDVEIRNTRVGDAYRAGRSRKFVTVIYDDQVWDDGEKGDKETCRRTRTNVWRNGVISHSRDL